MRKLLLVTLGLLFGAALPLWAAPDPVIRESVAVCNPAVPTQCAKPDSSGNLPVTGTTTPSGTSSNAADGVATSANNQSSVVYPFLWNGATFDRWPGSATLGAQVNVKAWGGTAVGAPSNYGTSPGAVVVPGVNAFITNSVPVTIATPTTPATGTGTPTAVTVGASSAQALAAATRTQRLTLQNVSATASIACSLGGTAALNTAGSFMIGPGQLLNLGDGLYVPGDAVNCIASVASTPLTAWSR